MATGWLALYAAYVVAALSIGVAIVYAGYQAYQARVRRAANAARPPPPDFDHVAELERLDTATIKALAEARATLEAARQTLQKGIRG